MSGSGPYTEGWLHENPDDPADRPVSTVELPHVVVSDELLERAWDAAADTLPGPHHHLGEEAIHAAINAVAGELWQAGYVAGRKLKGLTDPLTDDEYYAIEDEFGQAGVAGAERLIALRS